MVERPVLARAGKRIESVTRSFPKEIQFPFRKIATHRLLYSKITRDGRDHL
jgi:hypothetical protein